MLREDTAALLHVPRYAHPKQHLQGTHKSELLTLLAHVSLFTILITSRKKFNSCLQLSFYSQVETPPGLQEHLLRDYQPNECTN